MNVALLAARKKTGMTQKQVAEQSKVTERTYQGYEYGAEPGVRTAIRIAKIMNRTVEELFDETSLVDKC